MGHEVATGSIYRGNAILSPFYSTLVEKILVLMNGHAVEFVINTSLRLPLVQMVNSKFPIYARHTPHHRLDKYEFPASGT